MLFTSIMHVTFFAKDINITKKFYENMGCKMKMAVKYKAYADKPESQYYARAQETPEAYCIIYFEVAPGQFIEIYPSEKNQLPHTQYNSHIGYSHFGVIVEDIQKTREFLISRGVCIDIEPKIGNSRTWQMWIHDPDDNRIEIMQYTDQSYQLVGHLDT